MLRRSTRAGVPVCTISRIINDKTTPRVERLGELLRGVPDRVARAWLVAYLLDHVPAEWTTRAGVHVAESEGLAETPADYVAGEGDRFSAALEWLRKRGLSHDETAEWVVASVDLLQMALTSDCILNDTLSEDIKNDLSEMEKGIMAQLCELDKSRAPAQS